MLCGGGGQHYLFLNKILRYQYNFLGLFTISKWIKQYFPCKETYKDLLLMSNKLTILLVKRPNKKNIKSLDLTRKVNLLRHEKRL